MSDSVQVAPRLSRATLIPSLILGICEGGNHARAVCDLLVRILSLLKTEMHIEAGITLHDSVQENRKQRRKREAKTRKADNIAKTTVEQLGPSLLIPAWTQLWIEPLALALLQQNKNGRTQISSLFIPFISLLIGGNMHRADLCHVFSCLLDELVVKSKALGSVYHPDLSEVLLWAKLEVHPWIELYSFLF